MEHFGRDCDTLTGDQLLLSRAAQRTPARETQEQCPQSSIFFERLEFASRTIEN